MYNEYALRTTPKEIVSTYFGKEGNLYKVDPMLKRLISFGQINLSDQGTAPAGGEIADRILPQRHHLL